LNRIGVAYHKLKKFEKSLNFHKKHLEFTDSENIYAAYYNCGISLRFMKKYSESIEFFKNSLDWARKRQDAASECLSCGQLGLAYFLNKESGQALAFFQTCLKISKSLRNLRLQLD
jgi:tetratricopeptide (TPR) repeat protein